MGQGLTLTDVAFVGQHKTSVGAAPSTLLNGLTAYWTLDDSSSYVDSSGNAYTWTKNGTVNTSTGFITNAASFTGVAANNLSKGDADIWSAINSNSITFAGWVNLTVTNTFLGIIAKDAGSSTTREYQLGFNSNPSRLEWAVSTNSVSYAKAVSPTESHQTGVWYFFCAQIDATNLVAKVRQGTSSTLEAWGQSSTFNGFGFAGQGTNGTAIFALGVINGALPMNGLIDEVGVWQRLLTDQEVTNLWTSQKNGQSHPFTGY